jgi:hypothetical protein
MLNCLPCNFFQNNWPIPLHRQMEDIGVLHCIVFIYFAYYRLGEFTSFDWWDVLVEILRNWCS